VLNLTKDQLKLVPERLNLLNQDEQEKVRREQIRIIGDELESKPQASEQPSKRKKEIASEQIDTGRMESPIVQPSSKFDFCTALDSMRKNKEQKNKKSMEWQKNIK